MYDIFGNMDSIEEINACAAGLLQEGDGERILELAEENGIPEVFAQDLIEGRSTELTDCMNAAIGKLDVEAAGYKNNQIPVEPDLGLLKKPVHRRALCGVCATPHQDPWTNAWN